MDLPSSFRIINLQTNKHLIDEHISHDYEKIKFIDPPIRMEKQSWYNGSLVYTLDLPRNLLKKHPECKELYALINQFAQSGFL